jgi:hypothetical protein
VNHPIAILILVCAGAIVAPRSASAQMHKCEYRTLQNADEQRLAASAKALLPADVEPFVAHPCRNSDGATASIITAHVKADFGVLHWWEFACQRKPEDWQCDLPVLQQFIATPLLVGGKTRRVALTFDKDTTLRRAQQLSSRALTLFADPASQLPSCSSRVLDSHWTSLRARHLLPAGKRPLHVRVSVTDGANSVSLEDVQIEIRFLPGTDEASGSAAQCWNEWVSVT